MSIHLYEAAELDGAGVLHKIRHVTLPLTTSVIFFNSTTSIITAATEVVEVTLMRQEGTTVSPRTR